MHAIGIDLGGTNTKISIVHKSEGIIKKFSIPTEAAEGKNHVLARLADGIKKATKLAPDKPIGVGIGMPGMISMDRTIVQNPPNLPGWYVVNVAEEIENRTGFNCRIENDANLAALGSSRFGVGRRFESFIMLTLGTGVGGGIIFNKHLFRGTTGAAAELGHVIIDYDGPLSNSVAQGGIEAYLGQRFLSRYAADLIRQNTNNPLYDNFKNNFEELEPVDLYNAAIEDNKLAIRILKSAGEKLGYAIANYVYMMDIRKIVVSGGVAKAGGFILKPAEETALNRLMETFHEGFEIIYESLGNDAAMLGAATLALEEL